MQFAGVLLFWLFHKSEPPSFRGLEFHTIILIEGYLSWSKMYLFFPRGRLFLTRAGTLPLNWLNSSRQNATTAGSLRTKCFQYLRRDAFAHANIAHHQFHFLRKQTRQQDPPSSVHTLVIRRASSMPDRSRETRERTTTESSVLDPAVAPPPSPSWIDTSPLISPSIRPYLHLARADKQGSLEKKKTRHHIARYRFALR